MVFKVKTIEEVIDEIKAQGVALPEDAFCEDSFERWLRNRTQHEKSTGGEKYDK